MKSITHRREPVILELITHHLANLLHNLLLVGLYSIITGTSATHDFVEVRALMIEW